MWLWKDVTVLGKQVYYDSLTLIISPCQSLSEAAEKYNYTIIETQFHEGTMSETKMLHVTMRNKCYTYEETVLSDAIARLVTQCSPSKNDELLTAPISGQAIDEHLPRPIPKEYSQQTCYWRH